VSSDSEDNRAVEQFLLERIDSVPHLEARLLVWNTRSAPWSSEELAKRPFVNPDVAKGILQDLARQGPIVAISGADERCCCESEPGKDRLVESIDLTYRRELVRV